MLSWIQGAAILRHRTSDISQIAYVTGALLKEAKLGGHIGYVEYHWTDLGCLNVHAPVTSVTCSVPQDGSAVNPT